jgi:hypothetical protein
MWYKAGWYPRPTCYAVSQDGIHWEKPALDVVPGTNIVIPVDGDRRDGTTAWLDLEETDPARRYKYFQIMHNKPGGMADSRCRLFFSADGVHWTKVAAGDTRIRGERSTMFYNPFRKVWVFIIRNNVGGRHQDYYEDADPVHGTRVYEAKKTSWAYADQLDPPRLGKACQLYTLDCVAYESLVLGLFSIFRGDQSPDNDRPKWTDVCLGYSRDGFHWTRPDRRAFSPISDHRDDWNYGYIQSAGGGSLIVGDRLYFYLSGSAAKVRGRKEKNGTGYTGLVTLRRDGFVSMDAGDSPGALTTRPITFKGKHLFVNVDAAHGELCAEVLDPKGRALGPFTKEDCLPVRADETIAAVRWKSAAGLLSLTGRPVRFRFHLRGGSLYAFWISPDASGASHGYVAAGGPGFTGPTDTIGSAVSDE